MFVFLSDFLFFAFVNLITYYYSFHFSMLCPCLVFTLEPLYKTRMTTFIKPKLKKSDDPTNIDKYM